MALYDRDKAGEYNEPGFTLGLGRRYFLEKCLRYRAEGEASWGKVVNCQEALALIRRFR